MLRQCSRSTAPSLSGITPFVDPGALVTLPLVRQFGTKKSSESSSASNTKTRNRRLNQQSKTKYIPDVSGRMPLQGSSDSLDPSAAILGDYKRIVRGGHSRPPDLTPGDALRRNQIHKIQATRKEVLDRFEAREASEKGVPRADGAYHTDETMATRQSLGKRQWKEAMEKKRTDKRDRVERYIAHDKEMAHEYLRNTPLDMRENVVETLKEKRRVTEPPGRYVPREQLPLKGMMFDPEKRGGISPVRKVPSFATNDAPVSSFRPLSMRPDVSENVVSTSVEPRDPSPRRRRVASTPSQAFLQTPVSSLPFISFPRLGVAPHIWPKVHESGFHHPTAIQLAAIPHILPRKAYTPGFTPKHTLRDAAPHIPRHYDVVVQDMTGSGKTLAYLLPALQAVDVGVDDIQSIIVCPTRELCVQVHTMAAALAKSCSTSHGEIRVRRLNGILKPRDALQILAKPPHVLVTSPQSLKGLLELHLKLPGAQAPNKRHHLGVGSRSTSTIGNDEQEGNEADEENGSDKRKEQKKYPIDPDNVNIELWKEAQQKSRTTGESRDDYVILTDELADLYAVARTKEEKEEIMRFARQQEFRRRQARSLRHRGQKALDDVDESNDDIDGEGSEVDGEEIEWDSVGKSSLVDDVDTKRLREKDDEDASGLHVQEDMEDPLESLRRKVGSPQWWKKSYDASLFIKEFEEAALRLTAAARVAAGKRKAFTLGNLKLLIVDEADVCTLPPLVQHLIPILAQVRLVREEQLAKALLTLPAPSVRYPFERQPIKTVFVTATITRPLVRLACNFLRDPHLVTAEHMSPKPHDFDRNFATSAEALVRVPIASDQQIPSSSLKEDGNGEQPKSDPFSSAQLLDALPPEKLKRPSTPEEFNLAVVRAEARSLLRQGGRLLPSTIQHSYLTLRVPKAVFMSQFALDSRLPRRDIASFVGLPTTSKSDKDTTKLEQTKDDRETEDKKAEEWTWKDVVGLDPSLRPNNLSLDQLWGNNHKSHAERSGRRTLDIGRHLAYLKATGASEKKIAREIARIEKVRVIKDALEKAKKAQADKAAKLDAARRSLLGNKMKKRKGIDGNSTAMEGANEMETIEDRDGFDEVEDGIDPYYLTRFASPKEILELQKLDVALSKFIKLQTNMIARLHAAMNPRVCVVFGNNTTHFPELAMALRAKGFRVACVVRDSHKAIRNKALRDAESGNIDILLASNMLARGVDLRGVNLVINLGIPKDAFWYIHRAGRVDRMGGQQGCHVITLAPFVYTPDRIHSNEVAKEGDDSLREGSTGESDHTDVPNETLDTFDIEAEIAKEKAKLAEMATITRDQSPGATTEPNHVAHSGEDLKGLSPTTSTPPQEKVVKLVEKLNSEQRSVVRHIEALLGRRIMPAYLRAGKVYPLAAGSSPLICRQAKPKLSLIRTGRGNLVSSAVTHPLPNVSGIPSDDNHEFKKQDKDDNRWDGIDTVRGRVSIISNAETKIWQHDQPIWDSHEAMAQITVDKTPHEEESASRQQMKREGYRQWQRQRFAGRALRMAAATQGIPHLSLQNALSQTISHEREENGGGVLMTTNSLNGPIVPAKGTTRRRARSSESTYIGQFDREVGALSHISEEDGALAKLKAVQSSVAEFVRHRPSNETIVKGNLANDNLQASASCIDPKPIVGAKQPKGEDMISLASDRTVDIRDVDLEEGEKALRQEQRRKVLRSRTGRSRLI